MPTDTGKTWTPHLRIAFGGVLGSDSSGEIWSNTLRFLPGSTDPVNENLLQPVADGIAASLRAWFVDSASMIGQDAFLTYVKATWITATGKQRDQNTAIHEWPAPHPRGGMVTQPIWEQSYVITFRTQIKRGRGHAGRIYPPLSGSNPEALTPYCPAADATGMAHSFGVGLTKMAAAISHVIEPNGPTGFFAVFSPGDSEKGTSPVTSYISSVVVDRVADIMHSRTNRVKRLEGAPTVVPAAV